MSTLYHSCIQLEKIVGLNLHNRDKNTRHGVLLIVKMEFHSKNPIRIFALFVSLICTDDFHADKICRNLNMIVVDFFKRNEREKSARDVIDHSMSIWVCIKRFMFQLCLLYTQYTWFEHK